MRTDVLGWIALAAGIALTVVTAISLVKTLVVPRDYRSPLTKLVERCVSWPFIQVAGWFQDFERKDAVLVLQAPSMLMAMLLVWMLLFWLGFASILWSLTEGNAYWDALREAGSSMLTLGFARPQGTAPAIVSFAAAATGLVVVALLIAYLPALYASFNRRETLVTLLQGRAGAPAWGPEILARHQLVEMTDALPDFYARWEEWAADVAETHTNYPVLIHFRSPHALRSWVVGLLAVLDSAALYLSLCPSAAPTRARLCLRMGFTCLRDVARTLGIPYDPDPKPDDPIELSFEEFLGGIHRLQAVGFPIERTPEDAWPHFHGWRVNYEAVAYAIADRIVAVPGPWSGERKHLPGLSVVPVRPVDRRPGDSRPLESRPISRD